MACSRVIFTFTFIDIQFVSHIEHCVHTVLSVTFELTIYIYVYIYIYIYIYITAHDLSTFILLTATAAVRLLEQRKKYKQH